MTANTIGQSNGTIRFWLDGVMLMDHSDVVWITATHPVAFYGRKLDLTWGGMGGANRTREDDIAWDHISILVPPTSASANLLRK